MLAAILSMLLLLASHFAGAPAHGISPMDVGGPVGGGCQNGPC